MTDIETWIQSPAALALAKTLLHSLWQGAITAFVLAACLRFIRSARLRYSAACTALVVIVALSIATFLYVAPSADRAESRRVLFPGFAHLNPDDAEGRAAGTSQSV